MDESISENKKQKKSLDELDRKLIDLLYVDSRMNYSEIAKKLDVSVGSVHNRIKSLTDERGVIKKFTVQLDPEKLDLDLTVVIEMQIEVAYLSEVNNELQKFTDIIALYNITGGTDILAIARFKNRRHMNEVLTSILKIKHITRTATHLTLQILKEEWHSPSSDVTKDPDVKANLLKANLLNLNNSKHELEVEK